MSKYKLDKAYDQRGSSMGRKDYITEPLLDTTFHLERIPINKGGYDSGGAYWGTGAHLYIAYAQGSEEEQRVFVRAWTRSGAKTKVYQSFRNARFFK
jgi:hypothetical protein